MSKGPELWNDIIFRTCRMFDLGLDWAGVGRQAGSRLQEPHAVEFDIILQVRRYKRVSDGPFVAHSCVLFFLCKCFQSLVATI